MLVRECHACLFLRPEDKTFRKGPRWSCLDVLACAKRAEARKVTDRIDRQYESLFRWDVYHQRTVVRRQLSA